MKTSGLAYISSLSAYAWACVDSIEQRLIGNLREQELQQELEDLEKSLLTQADHLTEFIDSLSNQLTEPYVPTLKALEQAINSELRTYALEEDLKQKPDKAEHLISCMKEMEELALILSKLPDRWKEIQQLYTEQVWNPFTVTTMKDQVKERIPQAYNQLLIPAILNRIGTELNCGNTQKFRTVLDALHQRMHQLRRQNTSKLERKLKKEDDPK